MESEDRKGGGVQGVEAGSRPGASGRVSPLERAIQASLGLLAVAFLAVLLNYLFTGVRSVAPGETALVFRFGALQLPPEGPGLVVGFPAPIDVMDRVLTGGPQDLVMEAWVSRELPPTTQNETNFGTLRHSLHPVDDGYTLTGDANLLQGSFVLRYQVVDAVRFRLVAREPELIVRRSFYQAATRTLAVLGIDEVIPGGLELFRVRCLEVLQGILGELDLGVVVVGLEVKELLPPRPILPAFQDVNSARVEGQTMVDQARAYRVRMMQLAESEAGGLRRQAGAEAAARVTLARGGAERFLALQAAAAGGRADFRSRLLAETWEATLPKFHSVALLPEEGENQLWLRPATVGGR